MKAITLLRPMFKMHKHLSTQQLYEWQRLSPLSVVYFIFRIIKNILKQSIQGFAPLAAIVFVGGDKRWFIMGLVGLGVASLILLMGILSYLRFRYRLQNNTVLIQSGVFKQKRLSLSFERIQNMVLRTPLYFRPFNLLVLEIESTGSSGVEVSLGGIHKNLAALFQDEVMGGDKATPTTTTPQQDTGTGTPIFTLSLGELVRYGLSNTRTWVVAAFIMSFVSQVKWYEIDFLKSAFHNLSLFYGGVGLGTALVVFTFIMGLIGLILLLSVSSAIVINYGYQLYYQEGRFKRVRGLFEHQQTGLKTSKIQMMNLAQPWPALLFNRIHIFLAQVGFKKRRQNARVTSGSHFIIPSTTDDFVDNISNILFPNFHWQALELKKIHWKFVQKVITLIVLPICIALFSLVFLLSHDPRSFLIFLVPVLLLPFIILRKNRYGYASDGTHGLVQTGFLGRKRRIFAFYKVQNISIVQSPSQIKYSLATLTIQLSGGKIYLPYMNFDDAKAWRTNILNEIHTSHKNWL